MNLIVTTGIKTNPELTANAQNLAAALNSEYIPRDSLSIDSLRTRHNTDNILLVSKTQLKLIMPTGTYFFHIGMAKLRIKNLRDGKYDHMTDAMGLCPGDAVLDCTLGLGTDAVVSSFVLGAQGRLVGLDSSCIVTELVRRGLAAYNAEDVEIEAAMHRIEVICAEHIDYLRNLPDKSFDIVYFDPMFRYPLKDSSGIAPLRLLANPAPVTIEAISEAIRVARKRVVLKEASSSAEFTRLGFKHFCGGKYSSVMFGYIQTKEGE